MSLSKPLTSSYASVMKYDTAIEKLPTLHRYVWKGKFEKVLKFLSEDEHQWKVNKKDDYQRTPLHIASSKGDVKIVQFLLSIDVKSINCLDNDGCTPFYKAAQILSLDCMEALVSSGARTTCIDFKKNSIMDKIILESGDGATQCLQYLLTNGNQEKISRDGVKLLHSAVKYGRVAVVKMLIQLGIDLNSTITDDSEKTALMKAVENKYFTITILLLKNHASVYLKDVNGKVARDYTKDSQFLELLNEFDNTNFMLDEPTTNKVFVRFHKSSSVDKLNKPKHTEEMQTELARKVMEIEIEIKHYEENIKIEKIRSDEMKNDLQAIAKRNNASSKKASIKHNHEEFKRPKVMFKKIFKASYFTQEEWIEHFDALVERYDDLQRGYEKLLLVETEKELEIEECMEVLQNVREKKLSNEAKVIEMQRELSEVKNEVEKILDEKNTLKSEIEQLKESITNEKSKFKSLIQQANMIKGKLTKSLEMLKVKKRRKLEEIQVYLEEEANLLKEVEICDLVLNEQQTTKNKLVNKIKLFKRKCGLKKSANHNAHEKNNIK